MDAVKLWAGIAALGGVVAMLLAAIITCETGCANPTPAAEVNAANAASYEAEQLACVADAASREQADKCRDDVKRRYNRLDAGGQ